MMRSRLGETIQRVASRAASAVVARGRIDSPALNAALLRRLAVPPGTDGSFLADPVPELARVWETGRQTLGELSGTLLSERLVEAPEGALGDHRMPRDRRPYAHQFAAWESARDGFSCLVTFVLPAWAALADASGIEDLQVFWECGHCRAFGLARSVADACPSCAVPGLRWHRTLRPAGFIGRRQPHTGYEQLGHVPFEMPRLRADGAPWRALPDPGMGRLRADSGGEVITMSAGAHGHGYALCLQCGRAEAETEGGEGFTPAIPATMRGHYPLAIGAGVNLVQGRCPGGRKSPLQRNVRLVHAARSDVFELQLPVGHTASAALALAAALREALAARLGAEVREIGVAVGDSAGPTGERRLSLMLHDRAAGGAGLVSRLAEADWFDACVAAAAKRLDCVEDCANGCPACVLRPDLNFADRRIDRKAGLDLARNLRDHLEIPPSLRVFGAETDRLGQPLADWLDRHRTTLSGVTVFLHGVPEQWDLVAWPMANVLSRLRQAGVSARIVLRSAAITDRSFDLATKLDLHRLTALGTLAHAAELPRAGSAPVVAIIQQRGHVVAVAAPGAGEEVPRDEWALGAIARADGILPAEIGLFVRTRIQLSRARAAAEATGLPWLELSERDQEADGHVLIGTMHLAKGLEFKAAGVMACDDGVLPLQSRMEAVADETELDDVYETERQLVYVACTRARQVVDHGGQAGLGVPSGSRALLIGGSEGQSMASGPPKGPECCGPFGGPAGRVRTRPPMPAHGTLPTILPMLGL